tara:strand:- start:67 stop:393 length:327 start_codon:yes stop_codon:yes gene_type:complete
MKEEGQSFRSFVLTEAEQLVSVDRAATHGSAIDNFSLIAEHWTAHINARNKSDIKIQATDVCDMMELFKIGRRNASPSNIENYTDACGYAALSYEMFSVLISDKVNET